MRFKSTSLTDQTIHLIQPFLDINGVLNSLRYRRLGRNRTGNGKLLKLRTKLKNAQTPSRPVHLRMIAGDHFPPKNV
jgi:hypothetical protein